MRKDLWGVLVITLYVRTLTVHNVESVGQISRQSAVICTSTLSKMTLIELQINQMLSLFQFKF